MWKNIDLRFTPKDLDLIFFLLKSALLNEAL